MDIVRAGGAETLVVIVLGVLGIAVSVGAIVATLMSKSWHVPMIGCAVVIGVSFCSGCAGIATYGTRMSKLNEVVDYPGVDPALRELIIREGTYEAQIPLFAGLCSAIVPLIAAVVSGAFGMRRRSMPIAVPGLDQ